VRRGIANVRWPGRLEVMQKEPTVILDGAHNVAGVRALVSTLKGIFKNDNLVLVIGILSYKPKESMLGEICPLASKIFVTKPSVEKASDPEELCRIIKTFNPEVEIVSDVKTAVGRAVEHAGREGLVCVTGSLFNVAEAREMWMEDERGKNIFAG
jgi:dihydrofolate synthase/folylpolyglutamate synthase